MAKHYTREIVGKKMRCRKCGKLKPFAEFPAYTDHPEHLLPDCRQCQRIRYRVYNAARKSTAKPRTAKTGMGSVQRAILELLPSKTLTRFEIANELRKQKAKWRKMTIENFHVTVWRALRALVTRKLITSEKRERDRQVWWKMAENA